MARCGEGHKKLDANGVGKCSVPMWMNGIPAGFCNEPAYGKQVKCAKWRDGAGRLRRTDGRYDGYVPHLACPGHGGPKEPFLDIVFDGPPSHESGRFVEVENPDGASVNVGKWIDRKNGLWALRIPRAKAN